MNPRYRRMVQRLSESGPKEWSVYILRCEDDSLYTGIAKDVMRRFQRRREGKGAAYTRWRKPVELVYQEGPVTRASALRREAEIKTFSRAKKESLLRPR